MSENKEVIDITDGVQEIKPFSFGTAPSLFVNLIRDNRLYRFEMPVGAKLDECVEASERCLEIVIELRDKAKKKAEEEKIDGEKQKVDAEPKV